MNGWLTELEMNVINKNMINENAEKNDQTIGSDVDNQNEATENECEDLVNVLENNFTWSFRNIERMSEEQKVMTKSIIEIVEHNLDEEVNLFNKVDRNLLKDWTMRIKCWSERN